MRLNANDIVSTATVRSMRNVLLAASVVLFLKLESGVAEGAWRILGQEFSNQAVLQYAPWVISFFLIGHILHWLGDVRAYQIWFTENNVSLGVFDRVLEANPLKAMLKQVASLEKTTARIQEQLSGETAPKEGLSELEELKRRVTSLENAHSTLSSLRDSLPQSIDLLESISSKNKELGWWAKVHLYGWYFFLPLSLSSIAIVL